MTRDTIIEDSEDSQEARVPPLTPLERVACGVMLLWAMGLAAFLLIGIFCLPGCTTYKGGRIVDGSNLEIGMTVPGTDWSINFLSYTGGAKICGNDGTAIYVTNTVAESNSYFGVVTTSRRTTLTAEIAPVEQPAEDGGEDGGK